MPTDEQLLAEKIRRRRVMEDQQNLANGIIGEARGGASQTINYGEPAPAPRTYDDSMKLGSPGNYAAPSPEMARTALDMNLLDQSIRAGKLRELRAQKEASLKSGDRQGYAGLVEPVRRAELEANIGQRGVNTARLFTDRSSLDQSLGEYQAGQDSINKSYAASGQTPGMDSPQLQATRFFGLAPKFQQREADRSAAVGGEYGAQLEAIKQSKLQEAAMRDVGSQVADYNMRSAVEQARGGYEGDRANTEEAIQRSRIAAANGVAGVKKAESDANMAAAGIDPNEIGVLAESLRAAVAGGNTDAVDRALQGIMRRTNGNVDVLPPAIKNQIVESLPAQDVGVNTGNFVADTIANWLANRQIKRQKIEEARKVFGAPN